MCGRSKENTSKTTAASLYLNNQEGVKSSWWICVGQISCMTMSQINLGGLLYRSFRAVIGAGKLQTENKHVRNIIPEVVSATATHTSSGFQCRHGFSLQQLFLVFWYNSLLTNKIGAKIISTLRVIHSTSNSIQLSGSLHCWTFCWQMLDVEVDTLWEYQ